MSRSGGALDVSVHVVDGLVLPLEAERVRAAVEHVLHAEGVSDGEISIAFVGDGRMTQLNREYLQHEVPTDVISFPLHADDQPLLGDVYIGLEQASRQADELGVPLETELLRLAVHGTLHVLGHAHPEDESRDDSSMYRRQEALLASFLRLSDLEEAF